MDLEYEKRAALEARDRGETAYAQCGAHLRNIKAGVKHGEFLPWLKANKIDRVTAARWMREAAQPEKAEQRREKNRKPNVSRVAHLPDDDVHKGTLGTHPSELTFEHSPTAWFNRTNEAKAIAEYAPLETCPRTPKMKKAVRQAIEAWTVVYNHITEKE